MLIFHLSKILIPFEQCHSSIALLGNVLCYHQPKYFIEKYVLFSAPEIKIPNAVFKIY